MTYYMIYDDTVAGSERPTRLVEAQNPAQAIRHVAKRYTAKAAKASDLASLLVGPDALTIESASDD